MGVCEYASVVCSTYTRLPIYVQPSISLENEKYLRDNKVFGNFVRACELCVLIMMLICEMHIQKCTHTHAHTNKRTHKQTHKNTT